MCFQLFESFTFRSISREILHYRRNHCPYKPFADVNFVDAMQHVQLDTKNEHTAASVLMWIFPIENAFGNKSKQF